MANLRAYNQAGSFWDFISGLENTFGGDSEGKAWADRPFMRAADRASKAKQDRNMDAQDPEDPEEEDISATEAELQENDVDFGAPGASPWDDGSWGQAFAFGRRGRPGGRGGRGGRGFHGPPPPFDRAFPHHGGHPPHHGGPSSYGSYGPPPPPPPPPHPEEHGHHGKDHEHHGGPLGEGRQHKGHGGPKGAHHGPPHHGPGPRGHRGGSHRRGGRGGAHGFGGFGTSPAEAIGFLQSLAPQLFGGLDVPVVNKSKGSEDFVPPVDIFDTADAFVIHVSLPGAKKQDIGVHWDAEKSEVNITGVIHRPGDEEFLKTLALDERQVGAFERKVRLGSPVKPAAVDAEGISAKLEDGILRVNVPKEDKEFDVIHKIDVE